ncbi:hypothetical protein NDU88_003398 [Pleurodeles waltl]|uniref:Uncharacterized protein n=1 Tax=Pleurodeles waltl TaxID=8319 RepID=A0AAV7VD80_PLEWA|nr:hypothetical protein NDU88_003398 [Pleurodeles waltl]
MKIIRALSPPFSRACQVARTAASPSLQGERLRSAGSPSVWSYLESLCSARVGAVCTLVFVTVRHSASGFRFPWSPGLRLPLLGLGNAAHGRSSWFPLPAVGCLCGALIVPVLRLRSGSPAVYPSGTRAASLPVGAPCGQSHHARARTVTSFPGLRVGCQAAGALLLRHIQREPSGAQGSVPGSPSGRQLNTGSGNVDGP